MFSLHHQLQQDCFIVTQLPLCDVLLLNDSQYPWLILVPRVIDITEVCDLTAEQQLQFQHESNICCAVLRSEFNPDKLNVAALGNVVPQLHVHHIARYKADPCWPKPVWGQLPAKAYDKQNIEELVTRLETSFKKLVQG